MPPFRLSRATTLGLLLAIPAAHGCGWATEAQPNVILISIDNLRADHIAAYGYERPTTPNLDLLASEGVVFEQHSAQAPLPAPSRASLLTSRYPSDHGVSTPGDAPTEGSVHIADAFRRASYATAALAQGPADGFSAQFEEYRELRSLRDPQLVYEDIELTFAWLRRARPRSFFLLVAITEVGLPYDPPDDHAWFFSPRYSGELPTMITKELTEAIGDGSLRVSENDRAHVTSMYDAEILLVDEWLGRLLARVRSAGLESSTIVAVTSTNGERLMPPTPGSGEVPDEGILRIPLVLAGPGVPSGISVGAPSRSLDVAPTLLRLAGAPIPDSYVGQPLAPLWSGQR